MEDWKGEARDPSRDVCAIGAKRGRYHSRVGWLAPSIAWKDHLKTPPIHWPNKTDGSSYSWRWSPFLYLQQFLKYYNQVFSCRFIELSFYWIALLLFFSGIANASKICTHQKQGYNTNNNRVSVCLSVCLSVWLTDWLTDWLTESQSPVLITHLWNKYRPER